MTLSERPPILADKHHDAPSAFTPESLLREARRQKSAEAVAVPKVCLLDPDGDIVRQLRAEGRARRHDEWVCYHTDMWVFDLDGHEIGVVGCCRVALKGGHPQFVCHGLTEFHRLKGSGRGIEEALGSNRQRGGW